MLVLHETLAWAKESGQALIMLKLDFAKAYDSVNWHFLFQALTRMGIPKTLVTIVKLLLEDASATVSINGMCTSEFPIQRGVRQGCPLAPFLFLIVAEALAYATQAAVAFGRLRGITLPDGTTQHTLSQFADDTTFALQGSRHNLKEASTLLEDFGQAIGLRLNRGKYALYWFGTTCLPQWVNSFGCQIAAPGELSKLLGTPFGISVESVDVDAFLATKITAKLKFWTTTQLSFAGRSVIVNSILLSTLWGTSSVYGVAPKGS